MSEEASKSDSGHRWKDEAIAVVRQLRRNGYVAYFAGGCVRDMLLGLTPKDYDVATDAPPARVHQEDVPLAYAANLEALSMPSIDRIIAAVKAVTYK